MRWGLTKQEKISKLYSDAALAAVWTPTYAFLPIELLDGTWVWLEWVMCREIHGICLDERFNILDKVEYVRMPE